MNCVIVVGSTRDDAQSLKVGAFLGGRIKADYPSSNVEIVDLNLIDIPLEPKATSAEWDEALTKIDEADSYVVISPEWHGMAAPGIKNFFVHVGKRMSHKPTLLVAVSSGRGGAFPIAELRMSGYKNSRPLYLPDHLIIRDVKNVLNTPEPGDSSSDAYYHQKIDYYLKLLDSYERHMIAMRQEGVIDLENHPNGMS